MPPKPDHDAATLQCDRGTAGLEFPGASGVGDTIMDDDATDDDYTTDDDDATDVWNPYLNEVHYLSRNALHAWTMRERLVTKYAWAIPNEEALQVLAQHAPIVEIGAGTGYWARCLRERGVQIKAYDKHPYKNSYVGGCWTGVTVGGTRKAKQFPDRTLFLCWPPYATSFAADCLRQYQGSTVIYVGESEGGCNGDDDFFSLLDRDFVETTVVQIPRWSGIHDYLYVYRRKTP